ncbi:hypothetical protein KN815_33790 [Streptomyces sp. 4503]|uniref:Uncharacterized protein n=1 Tax=Streptomyces niphimycinicus TaxID=2842201 RepID=A0ABS6CPH5_9ACTN|nr:hypothetical protein [Streptomyces niphimycinicus]MBU3868843.1 hypothetical protein [Streptomyces niphimycinicus]
MPHRLYPLAEAGRASSPAGGAEVTPDWGRVAGRIRGEVTDDCAARLPRPRDVSGGVDDHTASLTGRL